MSRIVLGATVGWIGGLSVVSGCAFAVNQATPMPKFSLKTSRFDNSNFQGRLGSMLSMMDPATLFASDEEVLASDALLKLVEFNSNNNNTSNNVGKTDAELWRAKLLRDSAMHPDTKEIIPRPFRMAGYVPFNGPICVAMMVASTTPTLLFFNWVNQSQNALVNYFNRNASSPTSNETLAKSYATAVGAALCVAFGVSQVIQRKFNKDTATKLLKFVALPSSMIASSANAYIMRSPEIESGIALVDADGNEVVKGHRSKQAASKAVMETVQSRIIMQLPTFFVPPMLMMMLVAPSASPVTSLTVNVFLTLACFGLGLPASVAVFPQVGEISVEELSEAEVKQAAKARGLDKVFYNKGL